MFGAAKARKIMQNTSRRRLITFATGLMDPKTLKSIRNCSAVGVSIIGIAECEYREGEIARDYITWRSDEWQKSMDAPGWKTSIRDGRRTRNVKSEIPS